MNKWNKEWLRAIVVGDEKKKKQLLKEKGGL